MDLLKIAARVAADAPSVPGGGGGDMDLAQVENTLANALDNLDYDAVAAGDGSILLEGYEPWDTLWSERGVGVLVTVSQGKVGVSVQVEGESELAYGPVDQAAFNADEAAKAATAELKAALEG